MTTIVAVTVETDRHWPSGLEIDNRNAVIQELADKNVGKFMWSGKGAQCMDFAFEVHDVQATRTRIAKAMFNHLPGWKYSVEAIPAKLACTARLDSKHGIHAGKPLGKPKPEMGMGM